MCTSDDRRLLQEVRDKWQRAVDHCRWHVGVRTATTQRVHEGPRDRLKRVAATTAAVVSPRQHVRVAREQKQTDDRQRVVALRSDSAAIYNDERVVCTFRKQQSTTSELFVRLENNNLQRVSCLYV